MMKKILYSFFAFMMLGFGISLQIKAGIGQSMFNAFSLILGDLFNLEVGTVLNILNMMFFIAYLIIKRSRINRLDMIQIAATIANGYIVNFYVYIILNHLIIQTYYMKVIIFIIGLLLASLSLGAILAMEIIRFPLESLCILLGQKLGRSLATIRMRFDILFLVSTLLLTFVFSHSLYIREGTILSFFLLSKLIGLSYSFLKKHSAEKPGRQELEQP
ncbi:Membrane spanning protein [uncultured Eubacteriales bacterium]|uniref:Membrane spanning protein n=1 Tax=uncultured Eubacteriales bacterium TaxID=172733 RepID=A0A212JEH7_9FIRM|nr:Membrane spanning protein [uncultured Eubacteriales bacterium]